VDSNKSSYLYLKCDGGKLGAWHYGHSGGSIKCASRASVEDQASVSLECHNYATQGGHVWIQGVYCYNEYDGSSHQPYNDDSSDDDGQ